LDATSNRRASDLGETALVNRILDRLGPPPRSEIWSGDDAAVIEAEGSQLLFTVDTLVEAVDFDRSYATGTDVGYKALAVNVSDIAAMGGRASKGVVTLTIPSDTEVGFVDDVMTGLLEGAALWGVDLVGGDLGGGGEISISVALLGTSQAEPVLRSGARPGDAVCVTGVLGGAAGGLAVLKEGRPRSEADRALVERQLRPKPRLEEGSIAAGVGCSAMIDISDGFAVDLWRLLVAGKVGCEVDDDLVPLDPALMESGRVADPRETAIIGGEDFELLITMDDDLVDEARRRVEAAGNTLTRVGFITESGASIGGRDIDEWRSKAWEHLSGS
jgi:thiamine-monophosphate kinase